MSRFQFVGAGIETAGREDQIASSAEAIVIPARLPVGLLNPWTLLPPPIASLTSAPDLIAAVGITSPVTGDELWKAIAVAAAQGRLEINVDARSSIDDLVLPALNSERRVRPGTWFISHVENLPHQLDLADSPDVTALQAGLFQMVDLFDASHEASQAIEGEGRNRAGDYWHGINHRREPDYGNARYWFRRVGRHPLYAILPSDVDAIASKASKPVATELATLIRGGQFDPMRFIDLIEAALRSHNSELIAALERVQWAEMIRLLAMTWEDVKAAN